MALPTGARGVLDKPSADQLWVQKQRLGTNDERALRLRENSLDSVSDGVS